MNTKRSPRCSANCHRRAALRRQRPRRPIPRRKLLKKSWLTCSRRSQTVVRDSVVEVRQADFAAASALEPLEPVKEWRKTVNKLYHDVVSGGPNLTHEENRTRQRQRRTLFSMLEIGFMSTGRKTESYYSQDIWATPDTCGHQTLSWLLNKPSELIADELPAENGIVSTIRMYRHLREYNFVVLPITPSFIKTSSGTVLGPVNKYHVILVSLQCSRDQTSWGVLWDNKIYHNFYQYRVDSVFWINNPMLSQALICHDSWFCRTSNIPLVEPSVETWEE